MSIASDILSRFRGRSDIVAVGDNGAFRPHRLEPGKTVKPSWLEKRHLAGKVCLGFYLMTAASQVFCTCVDFDNKEATPDPEWQAKTDQLYYELCRLGLTPLVEMSQSGNAAHVWLFFNDPVDAWIPRAFWRVLSDVLERSYDEVYPRQDQLEPDGIGNLVRYPLWNQSRFVDVENEWATIEPQEALDGIRTATGVDLLGLGFQLSGRKLEQPSGYSGESPGVSSRVRTMLNREESLLGRRWRGDVSGLNDVSRSGVAQSIACELVRQYVPTAEIESALWEWCHANDYAKGDRDDWIRRTVDKAYKFMVQRTEERSRNASTMQNSCKLYLSEIARGGGRHIATGICAVDRSIDGVAAGEVAVVAARPGHGKSAFALQWLDTAAAAGVPCLIISEEMSAAELGKRAILSLSNSPERDWVECIERLRKEIDTHYADLAPIYVVENCNSIERVDEVVDQMVAVYGVKLVAVDYLQLLGGRQLTRYEVVTDISRRLKQAARRNDVSMLVLSQLNREIDKRDKRMPRLSDLRESGQIEQDADLVMFLQWPVKFELDPPKDSSRDKDNWDQAYYVYFAKRRNGPIRRPKVEIDFYANRQRFGDVEMERYDALDEWN